MKILFDGANAWCRAYHAPHALPPPGGPIFVMCRILGKLYKTYGRDNVIAVWEGGGHSGREFAFPEYKANRNQTIPPPSPGPIQTEGEVIIVEEPAPVKDLIWQHFKIMKEFVSLMGARFAQLEGFEADDVIASLATQTDEEIRIFSSDKDFYQLVSDRIQIIRPGLGKKPETTVDAASVQQQMGCTPAQVPMVRAFLGDPSDNIPRMPLRLAGKAKTAFWELVSISSSVEEFYSNLNAVALIRVNVEQKTRDALNEFRERALANQSLLRLARDLPVKIQKHEPNLPAAQAILDMGGIRVLNAQEMWGGP